MRSTASGELRPWLPQVSARLFVESEGLPGDDIECCAQGYDCQPTYAAGKVLWNAPIPSQERFGAVVLLKACAGPPVSCRTVLLRPGMLYPSVQTGCDWSDVRPMESRTVVDPGALGERHGSRQFSRDLLPYEVWYGR